MTDPSSPLSQDACRYGARAVPVKNEGDKSRPPQGTLP